MKKLNNLWTRLSTYKIWVFVFVVASVMIILGLVIYGIRTESDLKDIVVLLQLYILPASLLLTVLTIAENNVLAKRNLQLEKVKMTNEFVSRFRTIMRDFSLHSSLKKEYYQKQEFVKDIQKKIEQEKILQFDRDFLTKLIPSGHDYEELNKYVAVGKGDRTILSKYIEACLYINMLGSYTTNLSAFHKQTDMYLGTLDNIEHKKSESINEITKKSLEDTENQRGKVNKEFSDNKRTADILYAMSIRGLDADLLNDMECLLFNVNFDLLDYERLYHLIIDPFKRYMQTFYLDIVFTVINGYEKRDRELFSNIIEFYNKMIVRRHL